MAVIPIFEAEHLQAVCDIVADTERGLTGSEIERLLRQCEIADPLPSDTKRYRLFEALSGKQQEECCGNGVLNFLQIAMNPVRYRKTTELFDERRSDLNSVLAFKGISLGEDGKFRSVQKARTLNEAQQRADRLRTELERRKVHPDILKFCRAELINHNYFHAVLEATKSVAEKIRNKSEINGDGTTLVDQAFGFSRSSVPLMAFNTLQSDSEISEHRGLTSLMKGMFATFRNPTAHEPKIRWDLDEQDALDLLTLASLLHRRLDDAVATRVHHS